MNSALDRTLEFLGFRSRSYRLKFQKPFANDAVLRDLMRFCRVFESCAVPGDHDKTMILLGRQEVGLRIVHHLNLSVEQLYDLYGGVLSPPTVKDVTNG